MIRKIIYGIYAIIGMMVVAACSSRPDVYEISLEKMQGFPTEDAGFLKGVSALYAGVIDGNLLIAGGCNFPDTPAADDGKKVFYPDVYITMCISFSFQQLDDPLLELSLNKDLPVFC